MTGEGESAPGGSARDLVLGPLLRHVDDTTAAVWVETGTQARVTVRTGSGSWEAGTFAVHGHHYALVECDGLEPGTSTPYAVEVDGRTVWPLPDSDLPEPVITTLTPGRPLQLAYGSCRTSVPHDRKGNRTHGVDALRAYALALAGVTRPAQPPAWPDLVLFLGDQVYADETTEAMQEFIESRRDLDEPPGKELKDFEEYAHLYELAWSDPANRWLLSTLPTAMIFDDHDVRDDWNTSAAWRDRMEETSWWGERITAALASYWVYQHLGNLSPQERADDEVWRLVVDHPGTDEPDLTEALDTFARRVDREPGTYRWSYSREIGRTRLVVVDCRAARVLDGERSMLDPDEMEWLDHEVRGDVDHVLVATSVPFLLPEGLQDLEAFDEALAEGAWGRRAAAVGERMRQGFDLEHWGAFQRSFQRVAAMAMATAKGERGRRPHSVTFLSGDVHHNYVSQVTGGPPDASAIIQAVCSPIRNPLPYPLRFATAALAYGLAGTTGRLAARSAKVADPPFGWRRVKGPWFDNNLATLEVTDDGLLLGWVTGKVHRGRHDRPDLEEVAAVRVGRDRRAVPG